MAVIKPSFAKLWLTLHQKQKVIIIMRKKSFILLLLFISNTSLFSQNPLTEDALLEKQIYETGLIHAPLPLNTSRSFEENALKKEVLSSQPLTETEGADGWTYTGKRAAGSPSDPDYATYGNSRITYHVDGRNWEKYNRIYFSIYPDCDGARVVNMNLTFTNDSSTPKQGYNLPSGSHLINLVNKQWNHCFLEIDEYQRDKVISISFDTALKGKDRTTGDSAIYYVDDIRLQQIKNPEKVSGWEPAEHTIIYSTTGYAINSPKTALAHANSCKQWKQFQLINSVSKEVAYEGALKQEQTTIGQFGVMDFTDFNQPGDYQLKVGKNITPAFRIGEKLWDNSLWKVLNFLFCQRCGHPVPGKHAACHTDLFSRHDGKSIAYSGGWHDAGVTDRRCDFLPTGSIQPAQNQKYSVGSPSAGRSGMGDRVHTEKPLWRRLSCQQYGTAYLARRHPEYIG